MQLSLSLSASFIVLLTMEFSWKNSHSRKTINKTTTTNNTTITEEPYYLLVPLVCANQPWLREPTNRNQKYHDHSQLASPTLGQSSPTLGQSSPTLGQSYP